MNTLDIYTEKGRKEGFEKGIQEGIEKGIQEGIEKGKKDVVENLIEKLGLDDKQAAEIAEVTCQFCEKSSRNLR